MSFDFLTASLSEEDQKVVLDYVGAIERQDVVVIFDAEHLSRLVGYEPELVYAISNASDKFYRRFTINKKSGGVRNIDEPLPTLKEIQRWMLRNILDKVKVSRAARAYKQGTSLRGNASIHTRQKLVMGMDVKDFFGSLRFEAVRTFFFGLGYTHELSFVLANICCLNGSLPQGAPTSAALSNILLREFDETILNHCRSMSVRYSRYADDITISGDFEIGPMKKFISGELKKLNLVLNDGKFRIMKQGTRQLVTGLIVNKSTNAPREQRKEFRQCVYYIKKYGLDGHMRNKNITKQNYLDHLIGRGAYLAYVSRGDAQIKSDLQYLRHLKVSYG